MKHAWAAIALSLLAACDQAGRGADGGAEPPAVARPALCERAGDDVVRDLFCAQDAPTVSSLKELLTPLDLDPSTFDPDALDAYLKIDPGRHIAVLGHSTALSGHLVSPINPRVIFIGANVMIAYQRGVQKVELATRDRQSGELVLYLLTFQQACNADDGGCSHGALYTEAVERDWQRVELEDDEALKNTPSDCRQCHRRGTESSQLLMRELESPWTHFFFPTQIESQQPGENGSALMHDYDAAKGDERYGGVDLSTITPIAVFNLQGIVGAAQPLLFDAPKIESERWPWTPEDGYATSVHPSPTWESAYEAFKRGEQLALPYVELRATDPDKQAALAEAYTRYRDGELDEAALPDLGDIHPDDPKLRARIGLATEPDATPAEALIQACGTCHNDVLDQSVSRARFNIAIGRMSRAELDLAIARIEQPSSVPGAMPPPEARQLAPEARERLLEYLKGDIDPDEVDPSLERAAKLGMTGGGSEGSGSVLLQGVDPL